LCVGRIAGPWTPVKGFHKKGKGESQKKEGNRNGSLGGPDPKRFRVWVPRGRPWSVMGGGGKKGRRNNVQDTKVLQKASFIFTTQKTKKNGEGNNCYIEPSQGGGAGRAWTEWVWGGGEAIWGGVGGGCGSGTGGVGGVGG